LRANVIHTDLNPCGGAEQLAIGTIQALLELGIDVDLTTAKPPDISRIKNAFGDDRVGRIFNQIKKVNFLGELPIDPNLRSTSSQHAKDCNYGVVINTHGDVLPYFLPSFSRSTAITYCHFPVAIEPINSSDQSYLKYLGDLGLVAKEIVNGDAQTRNGFWHNLREHYLLMLTNSLVMTNSNFSKDAILMTLENNKRPTDTQPLIIPPPVNVEEFRRGALFSAERDDYILVVSRMHPSKRLENAIKLSKMLKQDAVGKGMIIVGSLLDDDYYANEYYHKIMDMATTLDVADYVSIETNVGLARLEKLMRKSKVYFHPLPGEPFGISVAEAMSAGLVPVVPDIGGQTEFVPKKYQFDSLEGAAHIISSALNIEKDERFRLSDIVMTLTLSEYSKRFQRVIKTMLASMNELPALQENK
jgi:alpha-1,2-mannosyltransferase